VIITLIAAFISNFADLPAVRNAFAGIRVCVFVLIVEALLKLRKKALVDPVTAVLFLLVFFLSIITPVSPVIFVLISGLAGIILQARKNGGAR